MGRHRLEPVEEQSAGACCRPLSGARVLRSLWACAAVGHAQASPGGTACPQRPFPCRRPGALLLLVLAFSSCVGFALSSGIILEILFFVKRKKVFYLLLKLPVKLVCKIVTFASPQEYNFPLLTCS